MLADVFGVNRGEIVGVPLWGLFGRSGAGIQNKETRSSFDWLSTSTSLWPWVVWSGKLFKKGPPNNRQVDLWANDPKPTNKTVQVPCALTVPLAPTDSNGWPALGLLPDWNSKVAAGQRQMTGSVGFRKVDKNWSQTTIDINWYHTKYCYTKVTGWSQQDHPKAIPVGSMSRNQRITHFFNSWVNPLFSTGPLKFNSFSYVYQMVLLWKFISWISLKTWSDVKSQNWVDPYGYGSKLGTSIKLDG